MKILTLQVDGEQYPVKFGFGSNRILGESWNINTYGGVLAEVQKLFPEGEELKLSQYEKLGDIVLSGIQFAAYKAKQPEPKIDSDDVVEALFVDVDLMTEMIQAYVASIPQSGEKVNPVKRKNAKRVKK